MAGGRGGAFLGRSPEELRSLIRKAEDRTIFAAFEAELADILNGLLGNYNDRDTVEVGRRLEEIKTSIREKVEGTFDQMYGGSVAKHTYVDGLSDVDSLMIINGSEFEGAAKRDFRAASKTAFCVTR